MSTDLANFYNRTRTARKIIVVDLGFLGDTVHLVPALWELKRHYPQAELHALTTPVGCEVLGLAPCVTRAWAVELLPPKRSLGQQWRIVRALRREHFEVAFNFSGADRTLFMTALTGARWRVGYPCGRWHFWNRWLIPLWVPRRSDARPVFEQRRQVLADCGLELAPARFDLQIPHTVRDWAAAQIPAGAIHFSINASTHLKEWPLDNWIELARRLRRERTSLEIVATGSNHPRERERLEEFAGASGISSQRFFSGLPVAQLGALLARCALHVGGDSGVLHMAMAIGTPTLSLFREYAELEEWAPRGPQHRRLIVKCPCIDQKRADCLERKNPICLAGLTCETVADAVKDQLEAILQRK